MFTEACSPQFKTQLTHLVNMKEVRQIKKTQGSFFFFFQTCGTPPTPFPSKGVMPIYGYFLWHFWTINISSSSFKTCFAYNGLTLKYFFGSDNKLKIVIDCEHNLMIHLMIIHRGTGSKETPQYTKHVLKVVDQYVTLQLFIKI